MIPFAYSRADTTADAVRAVSADPDAAFIAGGTNLVDHMRLEIATPRTLVDVSRLPLGDVIDTADGGVAIGASVRNSDLAEHPAVRSRYPALSTALLSGASGQLRNLATTGGNLLQRTRCPYFHDPTTPCNKREPGTGCSALGGYARDAAIFAATPDCVATHPSDMAVALALYGGVVQVLGAAGDREIPLNEFYANEDPSHDTVLAHGELITGVRLPPPTGAPSTYRKVRDRESYAFALVSVAASLRVDGGHVADVRIACGGVAHKPWRAARAEEALRGAPASAASYEAAADAELAAADPLPGNEFKRRLLRGTLTAVLSELSEEQ
ncbi:FAD binding domain-containing protein [Spelaeicoccus albus]|uniref:Xanthine dehydrogenase YagS FAD-binding subunit n=1 Tax=Spelaeicoccus albus TaxID=1280376 RepID=A0A7Z0ABF7_9MICO|nr:xanthine dehydrogenase family protein subunit M [Spelaeicoccus albus]NYI66770.1 xanthine dehydrogenase YagS FAD-binding subunit [Spelaeicoccus albus]